MIRSYEHALGTGFFIFTSYFVTKKYFIIEGNKFNLDIRNLIRALGYIRTGVMFLQGSLLNVKAKSFWNKITL